MFHISEEQIEEIRCAADAGETVERTFSTEVVAEDGTTVAEVDKLLYVRRKPPDPRPARSRLHLTSTPPWFSY